MFRLVGVLESGAFVRGQYLLLIKRIVNLRDKYCDERGNKIILQVEQHFKKNWAKAATFEVHETNNGEYLVSSRGSHRAEGHVINPTHEMCTCGYWQEYQVPCCHACAYGCMKLECEADFLSSQYIDNIHRFCSLQELYAVNINPVILDTVLFDLETKPKQRSSQKEKTEVQVEICN